MGNHWDAFVPQPLFWKEVFRVLKPGGHLLCFFGTRTYDWGTLAIRMAGFEIRDMITWHYGSGFPKSVNCGDGIGTALKPATEPICVARKPLSGTVKQNIEIYGTAGINIDACRIETTEDTTRKLSDRHNGNHSYGFKQSGVNPQNDLGRFPSNVILDPFTSALIDKQSGILTSGGGRKEDDGKRNYVKNAASNSLSGDRSDTKEKFWDEERQDWYSLGKVWADSGGASRFYYCAKSSPSERNAGCENLLDKQGGFKNTSGRGLSSGDPYKDVITKNNHPTVKPISLMRWLIRLVTPKGGVCLDPFAGSGTSGCAAAFEEINMVLMEMESKYIPIIEARTKYWQKKANRENYEKSFLNSVQTLF